MPTASAEPLESTFAPLHSQTVFEEAIERIGTAIKLGLLLPGQRLPAERELCARLGISRSTLRLALTDLAHNGYVRAARGRGGGTFVAASPPRVEPPLGDLLAGWRESCDVRMAVELGVAALAAERASDERLDALDALVDDMDAMLEDFDAYRHADARLHITLAEATGSRRLASMATGVHGAMIDLEGHIAHAPERLARSNGQHRRLLAAVRDRDSSLAVAEMAEHLRGTERLLAGLAALAAT
jgi:DNA-binding FadR family transcriptional regulator